MQLYCLTFPNGKKYIGITSKTAQERFKEHCHPSYKRGLCQHAIHKYGKENVVLTVLATVDNWELLCLAEIEAIEKFNTFYPNGYNMTLGGEGNLTLNFTGQDKKKHAYNVYKKWFSKNKQLLNANSKKYYYDNRSKQLIKAKENRKKAKKELSEKDHDYQLSKKIERSLKASAYYKKNKDYILAKNKEWDDNNKEKIRLKKQEYYEANKKIIAERQSQYHSKNRDAINEKHRIRYRKKMDKLAAEKLSAAIKDT